MNEDSFISLLYKGWIGKELMLFIVHRGYVEQREKGKDKAFL